MPIPRRSRSHSRVLFSQPPPYHNRIPPDVHTRPMRAFFMFSTVGLKQRYYCRFIWRGKWKRSVVIEAAAHETDALTIHLTALAPMVKIPPDPQSARRGQRVLL